MFFSFSSEIPREAPLIRDERGECIFKERESVMLCSKTGESSCESPVTGSNPLWPSGREEASQGLTLGVISFQTVPGAH